MPYNSTADLPASVKKLSAKKQRQWMHVWNSSFKKYHDEAKAAKMANGVVGGKKEFIDELLSLADTEPTPEVKGWIDSWEVDRRQIDQVEANYRAMGGSQEKGCHNCHWFVPQNDACVIVAGDIYHTGISDYWMLQEVYQPDPMPVTIVDETKSIVDRMKDWWTGLSGSKDERPFRLFKDTNGDLRFLARPSNNFKDRDGDILPTSAHEEYAAWADEHKSYPELWNWHAKGTKYGQVDFIDVVDGFVVMSGTIDKGMEEVAYKVNAQKNVAMSHGFVAQFKDHVCLMYRDFEISTLPSTHASNPWTDFTLFGEQEMPFSDAKKTWLSGLYGADKVAALEAENKQLAEHLKGQGVEWKEDDSATQPPSTVLIEQVANLTTAVTTLAGQIGQMATAQSTQGKDIEELKKGLDAKVAQTLTPPVVAATGAERPSAAGGNVKEGEPVQKDVDWFQDLIHNSVVNSGVR